jgi:hypothetical protein
MQDPKIRDHKLIEKEVGEAYDITEEADSEIEGMRREALEADMTLTLREEICEEAEEEEGED